MRWMNLELIIHSEVSQKEKNKCYILTCVYMESRKMVLMNLFAGQQWRHSHREQTYGQGHGGEERKGAMNGESSMEVYTLTHIK